MQEVEYGELYKHQKQISGLHFWVPWYVTRTNYLDIVHDAITVFVS